MPGIFQVERSFISIHAPPRGATNRKVSKSRKDVDFNSRPSARGDVRRRHARAQVLPISIHAPPRGATRPSAGIGTSVGYFNSRPSARGDTTALVLTITRCQFQFTPLREGRQHCGINTLLIPFISIHAPPRGATRPRAARHTSAVAFQFTPLREGRQYSLPERNALTYFNSRPSARGD